MIEKKLGEELTKIVRDYAMRDGATMAKIIGTIEVVKAETIQLYINQRQETNDDSMVENR